MSKIIFPINAYCNIAIIFVLSAIAKMKQFYFKNTNLMSHLNLYKRNSFFYHKEQKMKTITVTHA